MLALSAQKRDKKTEKNQKLQKGGKIPAVFYGKKEKSMPISIDLAEFNKVLKEAGESTVITLKIENGEKEALIKDVDFDPVTNVPRHADFYVFEKGHKLEVSVPLEFIGVSSAVKESGGTLVKVLYELNIKAMPKDLPHEIKVDITPLENFESRILAKDIKLPEGVELQEKPEEVVALVEEVKEEVEVVEAAPVDLSSIEVEKKGKKEEEEAGEETAATLPQSKEQKN